MNNNTTCAQFTTESSQIIMQPPLYFAQQHVWNVCFHPTADIIACCEISGMIQVLSYNSDDVKPLIQTTDLHKSSARFCCFNPSGNRKYLLIEVLATCSQDKRLGFLDGSGKVAHIIKKAHPSPINRCKFISDQVLISGDDDGLVKVWDLRTVAPVFQAQDQGEAITGIAFDQQISEYQIYTSCLNGTIAAYDMRQSSESASKLLCLSDSIDEELLGIQFVKGGKYIVCPSSEGCVIVYKREEMEHHTDRLQGQPGSVDAIIKIDENTIVTGSEDGFLRGVSLFPNKILHVLGQHEEQENFPIQSLSLSRCKRFAASSSHDNSIKFYDINDFVQNRLKVEQSGDQVKMQMELERQQSEQSSVLNWEAKEQNVSDFEDDSDDSDDSEDSDNQQEKKKKKKKSKKMSFKARQKELKKDNVKSFFKGL